jgi:hypothetical protein
VLKTGEGWEMPCQPLLNSSINFFIGPVTSRDQRIQNKADRSAIPGFHRETAAACGGGSARVLEQSSLALLAAAGNIEANQKREERMTVSFVLCVSALIAFCSAGIAWAEPTAIIN